MKKLLIAFLLVASMAGAQTLNVPQISATSQSCFVASCAASVTPPTANTLASWTATPVIDVLGEFDEANSRFVAAKAYPKFFARASIYMAIAGGSYRVIEIRKNGAIIARNLTEVGTGAGPTAETSTITSLAKGDILTVTYQHDSTPTALDPQYQAFQGYELP